MSTRPPAGAETSGALRRPGPESVVGREAWPGIAPRAVSQRHPRGTVAVLVSRFPLITETFILREIQEMERQGQPVRLVPLIEEDPEVVHPDAEPWTRRALTTDWLSPGILGSNLRRLRRAPVRYLRILWRQLRGALGSWNFLVRTAALFPKAVHLAERLEREGVRHLHAHFATHPATVARIIASLTDIDYSFTAHAHDIFVRQQMLGDKVREARFVRVISRYNRDYLRSLYPDVPAEKLKVIPVGIDVDAYAGAFPARSFARACLGQGGAPLPEEVSASPGRTAAGPADEHHLLCVAALKPYKGIPVLLDACRRLLDDGLELRCDLVGDGPLRDDVESMIDELELGDAVRVLGARPQEEVARRMSEASVLVLPSVVAPDGQMEGIPVVLMEAMASGCPVVSSRISGIPELLRDGVDGILTEAGDAAAVAAAVRRILEEPGEAERMARNARASVRARHRLSDTVAGLLRQLEPAAAVPDDDAPPALEAGWERLRGLRVGVRRVRERTDSRVLEIMASDGRRVRELVVKSQRSRGGESRPPSRRAAREFAFLRRCHRRGLGVPAPLELDEERAAILMSRCHGECLERRLRDVRMRIGRDPWRRLAGDLRAAGRWLRTFQQLGPLPAAGDVGGGAGQPSLDAILDEADVRAGLCAREGLLDEQAPVEWLDMLRASFRPGSTVPVPSHGDFWPGNVFVDDGGVEVIDFEGAGVGHPWQDAGYFLVHLQLYLDHPFLRRRGADLMEAFVDGLGGDRLDEATLRFARIVVALELLAREARRRAGNGDGRSSLGRRQLRCLRRIVLGGRA